MSDEPNFNADVLLEQIKKARADFEEAESQIKKSRQKRDASTREFKRIVEELYKKNLELARKLKACEDNNNGKRETT